MDASPTTNPREIKFEWSAEFAKIVKRRHFSRVIRRPCIIFLGIGILGLLEVWRRLQRGEPGGISWFFICLSVFPFALWAVHHLATSQIRCDGSVPQVSVRIEPEGITVKSGKGDSTAKWSAIKTMWNFPEVVLLFWDDKKRLEHAFALPNAVLGEEARQYIEDRIKEHGGTVA